MANTSLCQYQYVLSKIKYLHLGDLRILQKDANDLCGILFLCVRQLDIPEIAMRINMYGVPIDSLSL